VKIESKKIPLWIRLCLCFCKKRVTIDPAFIGEVSAMVFYKRFRGKIYIIDEQIRSKHED